MLNLGVNVVLFNEAGQVLLTKREDFEVWCLPSGGVEPGESLAEAARREKVSEQAIGNWKRQFLEGGKAGIEAGKSKPSSREQQLEDEVAELTGASPVDRSRPGGAPPTGPARPARKAMKA